MKDVRYQSRVPDGDGYWGKTNVPVKVSVSKSYMNT